VIDAAYRGPPLLAPKLPGSDTPAELKPFLTKSVVHLGGFGPWFSLALLVALASALWAALRGRRTAGRRVLLLAPPALLLLSALVLPEPWWARYVPQLWLVPVVVAVALLTGGASDADVGERRLGWAVVGVTALNALLVALLFIAGNLPRQLDMQEQLQSLRLLSAEQALLMEFTLAPATALTLDEAGIRWHAAAQPCEAPGGWVSVEYTYARVCLDEAQRARYRSQSPLVEKFKSLR